MKQPAKLYWIEYTEYGPLYPTTLFEAVGFDIKCNGWDSHDPSRLMGYVIPQIEAWEPEVVVAWLMAEGPELEPPEWMRACQYIREHPKLQNTKLIAFLSLLTASPEQHEIWRQRYDFFTLLPIDFIEHMRIIKRLIGEEVYGFEGVNYALQHRYGEWQIEEMLLSEQNPEALRPNAVGAFSHTPVARILTPVVTNTPFGYDWNPSPIQAHTPTTIVYIIKDKQGWNRGLTPEEQVRLARLAHSLPSGQQLLLGANDALLRALPGATYQVLKQAQTSGGWQVFINEHLWLEGALPFVYAEQILYKGLPNVMWPFTYDFFAL